MIRARHLTFFVSRCCMWAVGVRESKGDALTNNDELTACIRTGSVSSNFSAVTPVRAGAFDKTVARKLITRFENRC